VCHGLIVAVTLLLLPAGQALRAAIIGHEPFIYQNGAITGKSEGTYWDWSVDAAGHTGPSSTWDNLGGFSAATVTDGKLITTGTAAAKREFNGASETFGAFKGVGTVYFKVTMKRNGTAESSGLSSYDFGTERIFFGVPAALDSGQRKFAISVVNSGALDGTTWSTLSPVADHDYTLVAKLDFTLNSLTLWVDPVLARPESANGFSQVAARLYTGDNWSSAIRLASTGGTTTWEELAINSSLQVGLTAYWPFEDTLEDLADELPATSNIVADNGAFAGPATDTGYADGKFGRCFQSNGGGGYISVPFSADTTGAGSGTTGFTVSAWFRADAFDTAYQTLIAQGENPRWRVARYGTTGRMSYAGGAPGAQDVQSTSSFTAPTGWIHLVAVTQTGVATRLYINGVLENSNSTAPYIGHDGTTNLFIGANPNNAGREWKGDIDDVALWNRPLSAAEIATLYATGQSGQSLARLAANTLTVTTTADNLDSPAGAQLSLREAIRDAARGDIIRFDSTLANQIISLNNNRLTIDKSLTLDCTDIPGSVTVSAGSSTPVIEITAGNHLVTIDNLTISGGNAVSGNGGGIINHGHLRVDHCFIYNNRANNGGGIWNEGVLTVTESRIYFNTGDIRGGGIDNQGSCRVIRSTLGYNTAYSGGGIDDTGAIYLSSTTVSNNNASYGGGVFNSGITSLNQCTISNNSAGGGSGGGIYDMNDGTQSLTLANTIVAANPTGGDIQLNSSVVTRQGVNFIGENAASAGTFPAGFPNSNGDFVGTAASRLDPKLMPLNSFGGRTDTLLPGPGSPVMDRITPTANMLADTDQRGMDRVMWGKVDIGAVEASISTHGTWEVREIFRSPATALNNLTDVDALIADPAARVVVSQPAVINRADPETNPTGGGYFGGDEPFACNNLTPQGLVNGDDNDFALVARCYIYIYSEDDYTFGFSSDDGARLRIFGATFTSSTRLNPANPSNPAHNGDTLTYSGVTGNSNTLGVCHLTSGYYFVEFVSWDRSAGAYAEVFVARGTRTSVDSNFRLLGDYSSATQSPGALVNNWSVVTIRNNAQNLTEALNQVYACWAGTPQPNTMTAVATTINFRDPESGGGGHGDTQMAFPGNLAGDDNYFALGATSKLQISTTGYHTFCILSDDGARFRIKGSRGWTVTSPNAAQTLPKTLVDGFEVDGKGGDVLGQVYLKAGTYDLELIYHEAVAGAYVGLWGATGRHNAFSTGTFFLVGAATASQAIIPCGTAWQTAVFLGGPLNDAFAAAFPLYGAVAHDSTWIDGAHIEIQEPTSNGRNRTIWWQWQAPASGSVQVDTTGSGVDTILAVYSGGSLSSLTQMGFNDNWLGWTSRVTFTAVAGTIYHIQVSTTSDLTGRVCVNLGPLSAAPTNDNFNVPASLGSAATVSVTGSNLYATSQVGEPVHRSSGLGTAGASVWYSWTAPYSGNFLLDTLGSGVTAVVAVYTGSGSSFSGWKKIAVADWGSLELTAIGGVTYRIVVDGDTWFRGDYVLNLSPVPYVISSSVVSTNSTRNFKLKWRSEPWATYQIQFSDDLVSWQNLLSFSSYPSAGDATEATLTAIPISVPKIFFRVQRE
jgi:hypothetical protein